MKPYTTFAVIFGVLGLTVIWFGIETQTMLAIIAGAVILIIIAGTIPNDSN